MKCFCSRIVPAAAVLLLLSAARTWAESPAPSMDVPKAIFNYMERPEPEFRWENLGEKKFPGLGVVQHLKLTSQTWQNLTWQHDLMVYEPEGLKITDHMLLFVTGGAIGKEPKEGDIQQGLLLAKLCGARVATIHQVPNQPLFGDRFEDDLITETWLKYLATGDETWPLLFPMVKSAVKAMDALQQFAEQDRKTKVTGFVITGASKRGWTSWLTPVVDPRIVGTAPIVIDTLNFPAQMKYQKETWGAYSEQIADYTSKGLVKEETEPKTEREDRLWHMMDPYTYRKQLTLPKLLIVGTNDRYWTVDAMRMYYDDLVGPRAVLAAPNVGHNLGDRKAFALTTLAVFFRHAATGRPLPGVTWKFDKTPAEVRLDVVADQMPVNVRHWSAESPSFDFRESKWSPTEVETPTPKFHVLRAIPAGKNVATFVELEYEHDGTVYSLTTQVFRN
ncbi:MAG TPA: PhoPQ-activated protein PqaA family protein [Planctomycetaceae bacterium]|nr:PhoPQ-activated protein PqaA family protein [Planctomycetaceae bacterium]